MLILVAFSINAYSGSSELLVFTPALAMLNVTNPIVRCWITTGFISVRRIVALVVKSLRMIQLHKSLR